MIVGMMASVFPSAVVNSAYCIKYDASSVAQHLVALNDTSHGALTGFPSRRKKIVVVRRVKMTVTAYYKPLPGQKKYATGSFWHDRRLNGAGVKTSSGKKPRVGTIAADSRVFTPGTSLYVPGYGLGKVEDSGGAIKGRRLDVFMGAGQSALKKALNWNRRRVVVFVLGTSIQN